MTTRDLDIPIVYNTWSYMVAGDICEHIAKHSSEEYITAELDVMVLKVIDRMGGWQALSKLSIDAAYNLFNQFRECYLTLINMYYNMRAEDEQRVLAFSR